MNNFGEISLEMIPLRRLIGMEQNKLYIRADWIRMDGWMDGSSGLDSNGWMDGQWRAAISRRQLIGLFDCTNCISDTHGNRISCKKMRNIDQTNRMVW
jgi:hypothetical protein